jgi:hypothetical protein
MARRKTPPAPSAPASAARGASWMSLLAAATLGVTGMDQVRAHISAESDLGDGDLRLIVQSYPKGKLDGQRLPQEYAEPLASIQRSITSEELRNGVNVSFLQLSGEGTEADSVVVAWVEHGVPNLDYDALQARPRDGAYYGVAQRSDGEIVLSARRT